MSIAYTGNGAHAESAAAGTTIAVTLTGVVATDALVGMVTWDNVGGITLSTVKDQVPTSAAIDIQRPDVSITQSLALWSLPNSPGGSRTITATYSGTGATGSRGIQVLELSGATTGPMLTGTPVGNDSGVGTATAFDGSISTTPAVDGAFVLACGEGGSASVPTPAGGFALGQQDTTVNLVVTAYLVQGVAAPVSPSFTLSPADRWNVVIAAYAPAIALDGIVQQPPGGTPRQLVSSGPF